MGGVQRIADRLDKPELDDRSYRVIKLPNELEALLVHDPETDKASAAVSVGVGAFSDADDMPGMAHAVEHALFMGTKKYPVENEYSQYLSSNSGYSNAYTASTETNYFFEVAAKPSEGQTRSPLYGALDRFAQFFIEPLFLAETLDRELRAVDSENKKNLQNDSWRLMQLSKSLSNPKHPYSHFSTGNLQTLRDGPQKRGVNVRQAFIDFHTKHYSANRMKLVVLGRESLDQLEDWAVELFSDVTNKNLPKNTWEGVTPFTEKELQTEIVAKPVMEERRLELEFPYRDEDEMFETQPAHYLSHLIGHEGPGSLLAYLKSKGWVNSLSAGAHTVCPGEGFFELGMRLTKEGIKHYQEIASMIFHYIALLKAQPPQKWVFDELKIMSEIDFRFREKTPASSFASYYCTVMFKPYPREWLLSGSTLVRKFDPKLIEEGLSYLRPDNVRITLVDPDVQDADQSEKWYGTAYKVDAMSDKIRKMLQEAYEGKSARPTELHLPNKNEFLPQRLTVEKKEVSEPSKAPKLIRNEPGIKVWFKKDDQFWVPKGNVYVTLRSPLVRKSASTQAKTELFCVLIKDALNEYAYDADIAGLDYDISTTAIGFDITVAGYNDKMAVLLEKVLQHIQKADLNEDRFEILREKHMRNCRNFLVDQPYRQISFYSRMTEAKAIYDTPELLEALEKLTLADVKAHVAEMLKQMNIEMMVHGNVYKRDALSISDLVLSTLKIKPLPDNQKPVRRNLILPPGSDYIYQRTLSDPKNINNCIAYTVYIGQRFEMEKRAKLNLIVQLADEMCFNQLRTKEQLGYIVFSRAALSPTTFGYRILIQSERSVEYLEDRINAFLVFAGQTIENMPAETFSQHKQSLISKLEEKSKNLTEEAHKFWDHITSEYYGFTNVERQVALVKALSKADILAFFNHYILPTSPHRAKTSVHLIAAPIANGIVAPPDPSEQKDKLITFLNSTLNASGIPSSVEDMTSSFSSLDLSSTTAPALISSIDTYLSSIDELDASDRSELVSQLEEALGQILPGLGISLKPIDADDTGDAPLQPAPKLKPSVVIKDIDEWKATFEYTDGPAPLVDLKDYEEDLSKL